jgi:hypothetical protein
MNLTKIIFNQLAIIIITFYSCMCLNLSIGHAQNHGFNIGINNSGIAFGGRAKHNGLKFSLVDKGSHNLNGVGIGILGSCSDTVNGVQIGSIFSTNSIINGISIGGLGTESNLVNGISIGLFNFNDNLNGIATSLFYGLSNGASPKKINGISLAGVGTIADTLNGISVGFISNIFVVQKGVAISLFGNEAEILHGIQFGLINYAGNNRKIFRWMPLCNFNFRKSK